MIKKEKIKGSTLLLAIVIISTVLFTGIGVGTIISRQTREIGSISNEAIAFYIAESIVDSIDENFVDMNDFVEWNDMTTGKDIEYKATGEGEGFRVIIKVNNNYYSFTKEKGGDSGSGDLLGNIDVYFNYKSWTSPHPFSQISWKYEGGSPTVWTDMNNRGVGVGDWQKYTITGINTDHIYLKFKYEFTSEVNPSGDDYYLIQRENISSKSVKIDSNGVSPGAP